MACGRSALLLAFFWVVRSLRTSPGEKLIYYQGRFGRPEQTSGSRLGKCSASCRVSYSPSDFQHADAAVWNSCYPGSWPLEPPLRKPEGQHWVFSFFFEPVVYSQKKVERERRFVEALDRNSLIDWTMTYAADSDFYWPFARITPLRRESSETQLAGGNAQWQGWKARPKLLVVLVSHCISHRMAYLHKLQKLLPGGSMDIFGNCGKPFPCDGAPNQPACLAGLWAQYKFYAAFENMRFKGYITEKFFRPLEEGMVPLALGGSGRADYEALGLPAESFLHVDDFSSLGALAEHLQSGSTNATAFIRAFAWHRERRIANGKETRQQVFCELCQELYKAPQDQRPRRTFGRSLTKWWFDQEETPYPSAS